MEPKTVYYQLTASIFEWKISDKKTITAWGFNNILPGPVLQASKGDTLVVKLKNELPEPTIIHWHGIRLPSSMDGTDDVQRPVQPGEEFEYRFTLPDAGTFWYHSHQNETVQMEKGLYGSLIVKDDTDAPVDAERVLMIDDMKLDKKNQFLYGGFISRWKERHDGRQGDTLLINGKEGVTIDMNAGQVERWRVINSSSARYFRLSLEGRTFKLIATDGGLLESPRELTDLLITPGERVDILVGPFTNGESFPLGSVPYNRTTFLKSKQQQFATVVVGEQRPSIAKALPTSTHKIEALAPQHAQPNRKIQFSVGASLKHGIDFLVNGEMHHVDKPVYAGELQVWEISNTSLMDHPFHLHGFFFQVIEEDGKAPDYLAWKDTINLKPRSKVKIAWLPDNRPGMWMYHCHILEHHAAGMMAHFELVDPAKGRVSNHAHQPHAHHNHH